MFCTNCGKEVKDTQAFCTQCGTPLKAEKNINVVNNANTSNAVAQTNNIGTAPEVNKQNASKGKNNAGLLIGIIVAVFLVMSILVTGVIFAITHFISSNKSGKKEYSKNKETVIEDEDETISFDDEDVSSEEIAEAVENKDYYAEYIVNDIQNESYKAAEDFIFNGELAMVDDFLYGDGDMPYTGEGANFFNRGREFTFNEFAQVVQNSKMMPDSNSVVTADMTVLNNGIVVLRFNNMDIYSEGDDSYAAFFFVNKDGMLRLTYSYDSWARNYSYISESGTIYGYGSGGAGDSYIWAYYVDDSGKKINIYDENVTFSTWSIPYDMPGELNSIEGIDDGELHKITIGNKKYITYSVPNGTRTDGLDELVSYYENKGYQPVKDVDTIEEMKREAFEMQGINYEDDSEMNNWEKVNLPAFEPTVKESDSKSEYVIPDSDVRVLSEADLEGLTVDELRIARNEIYARHGRMFKDEELQMYFNSKSWYIPSIDPDDFQLSILSDVETENTKIITEYEKRFK